MKLWIVMLGLLMSLTVQANDATFKKTQQVVANMGPGCNVRIKIPVTAEFSVSYSDNSGRGGAGLKIENPFSLKIKTYIEPFYFGFTCYAADDVIVGAGAVRFDALRNEWVRDIEKRIAATGTSWSAKDTMEMRRDFAQAIQVYPLNSIDASGYAYTEYDTTGEWAWRRRILRYCLIKQPNALCGGAEYMGNNKNDLTSYALQILRSIEFIHDAAPAKSVGSEEIK